MDFDVFVSHSSKDKTVADATCAYLESKGIRCWIAPRDIRPGDSWGASIVRAMRGARVMVLIFSSHANASPQITREVELAVRCGLSVIPFRIEDVLPQDDLDYFLSTPHWLDAYIPPLEDHLHKLADAIVEILKMPAAPKMELPAALVESIHAHHPEAPDLTPHPEPVAPPSPVSSTAATPPVPDVPGPAAASAMVLPPVSASAGVKTSPSAGKAMLFAGLGFVFVPLSIVGIVYGHRALTEIEKDPTLPGKRKALTALVLGYGLIGLFCLLTFLMVVGMMTK